MIRIPCNSMDSESSKKKKVSKKGYTVLLYLFPSITFLPKAVTGLHFKVVRFLFFTSHIQVYQFYCTCFTPECFFPSLSWCLLAGNLTVLFTNMQCGLPGMV